MSLLNPSARARRNISFYAQVLQSAAIVLGGGWAVWTYHVQSQQQQKQAIDQVQSIKRELARPYDEKQLGLYLEASKIIADLATLPEGDERKKAEQRFWELYWGELTFVESRMDGVEGEKSVEGMMVKFCEQVYPKEKCHSALSNDARLVAAVNFAHKASDEITTWKSNITK
jgi:hypothetical protein